MAEKYGRRGMGTPLSFPQFFQRDTTFVTSCLHVRATKPFQKWTTIYEKSNSMSTVALPGPEIIKIFSMLNSAEHEMFLLMKVKMPTIVGILTFMSRKNSIIGLSELEKS